MTRSDEAAAIAIVQRQVDAFNAKDVVAFAACYTEDCRIYRPLLQEAPVLVGRATMIAQYGPHLATAVDERVLVEGRHYHDGLVFDVEFFPATQRRVTLGFEVLDALITRSWIFSVDRPRPARRS